MAFRVLAQAEKEVQKTKWWPQARRRYVCPASTLCVYGSCPHNSFSALQKKSQENINSRLALVMKSGKYTLGYKTCLKTLRSGKGKQATSNLIIMLSFAACVAVVLGVVQGVGMPLLQFICVFLSQPS